MCRAAFVLRAGARADNTVIPPPIDPRLPKIKTRSAGFLVMASNVVAPEGVLHGTLDPVTGYIPIDEAGVLYSDIFSVAVWRTLDVVRLVLMIIISLPIVIGLLAAVVALPGLLIIALPIFALFGFGFYRLVAIRRNYARIVGSMRTLTVQFDSPIWKRRRFHDELLRRAGISPSPIP